jgi:two-component system chemotaxis sensor kinase CheA
MAGADEEILQEFLAEAKENLDRLERELVAAETAGASPDAIAATFRTVHTIKGTAGFFGFARLQGLAHVAENVLSKVRDGELPLSGEIISAQLAVVDACRLMLEWVEQTGMDGDEDYTALRLRLDALTRAHVVAAPIAAAAAPAGHDAADTTIRVDIALLDRLMDLAGELVLARNQLVKLCAEPALAPTVQRLAAITSDLQDSVMKTRMQPIGGVWSKLPRVVRDLAGELGKQVRIELDGQDTGLDRSLLEAIKDPLTHIVRNAIDHGIEAPARRLAIGKSAEGLLRLRARHEGGHVMVEISDDGNGIDTDRVRAKAIERGVVTPEHAARLTPAETCALVFAAGFSTADTVTNVSGRGVGMDVVKTNIERIGGAVEIDSTRGAGTTIRLKIPLTLAIIPALIVSADGERYAVPQAGIVELVRAQRIEEISGTPVIRLRGDLLPLVYLGAVLGGQATGATVVVLQHEGRPFGLVVDTVHDTEEIVVKPTGKRLRSLATYAGATILGDGRIALILDVRGIATRAGLGTIAPRRSVPVVAEVVAAERYLVALIGPERRIAVNLDRVARLEELAASSVECAAGAEVVQYRDRVMPLVRLGQSTGETLNVIVCSGERDIGLIVDGIVDIFEHRIDGHAGPPVLDGRVTEIVDLASLAAGLEAA